MSNQNSETSPAMQRAIELFQAGQTVEAEETMRQPVRAAEERFGPDSPDTATAYNELGTILLNVGDLPGAVTAYRRACAGPMPTEELHLRDRLTYLMNLGMALQYANKPEEAEEALREGLQGRADYYGVDHPGYAFGLEPLATLLMREGNLEEALPMFEETVANFWRNGHPRVTTALALRAEAMKRAGVPGRAFEGVEHLPDEMLTEIANHVIHRTDESDPAVLSLVLQDFVSELKTRFGPDHWLVVNTLIWIVNLESMRGKHGDHAVRERAAREVITVHDRQRKPREAVQAVQGLALALSDAGRPEDAVAAYREGAERARRIGDPAVLSQLRRNFGILLSELKRDEEAEAELQGAVDDARRSRDAEMLSRAEIALGIFYQHRGRMDEAKPLLTAALGKINPAHSDAVIGRAHLQALEAGQSCGCDNQPEALAEAFREFVLSRLPADLLERFEVRCEEGDFKMDVHLKREPAREELDHLNRVIDHALTEFRNKLRERR